jgi:glycosyltransferase involved in cell wall biosynthesis
MPVVWIDSAIDWHDYFSLGNERFLRGDKWTTPVDGMHVFEPGFTHAIVPRPRALRRHLLASRLAIARRRLLKQGATQIALYLWRPTFAEAIELVEHDFACYHIDDEYGFSPTATANSPREVQLIERVDQVIVHTPALFEKKGGINPHTAIIPNGVDYRTFSIPQDIPADLAQIPAPRVGYLGWIKKQLDLRCLIAMARARPDCSFVLVGPIGNVSGKEEQLATLQGLANVHFLGVRAASALAAYAQHFDVCLMCYEVNDYTNFIYPLKLHEYLASGKPVISAAIRTAKAFSDFIEIAEDDAGWLAALDRALMPDSQRPEKVAKRQACAREHDWDVLVERIAAVFVAGFARRHGASALGLPA